MTLHTSASVSAAALALALVMVVALVNAPGERSTAYAMVQVPEATSLSGRPLYPPAVLPNRDALERDLEIAESVYNPTTAEAIITRGRRQAYLWRYRDAIATFTQGIARYPDDARLYRHR